MNFLRQFNSLGWSAFAALLLLWETASHALPGLRLYVPPISQVVPALASLFFSGTIGNHFVVSIGRFFAGYFIAATVAVSLGIVLGYFRYVYGLMHALIELLRPMPSVAIIPVAILMLGVGDAMIIAVTVYACVWPMLINTIDGVKNIDRTLIDTGRTFGLSGRQILWRIIVPGASPYIVTGLRIGLSIALILVTTAEMVAGSKGLGFFILDEERSMNSGNMYAGIIIVAAAGYTLNRAFLLVEHRVMKWRHGMVARGSP